MKRVSLIAVSVLVTLACDGDKPPTTPTTPVVATATSLGLSLSPAIQRVPPGETAQLIATARYTDGSTKDVTSQTTWTSSQTNVARVASGVVTGVALGRTFIQARFERWFASMNILIEPEGTFILSGRVTEPVAVGVTGATVEVTSGPPNQVLTSSGGFYELFGVGTAIVRVRKTGYFDESRSVTLSANQTLNVEITPRFAPANVAGTYRVTFTASPCGILPADLRTRTYTARIDQNVASLSVKLSDAQFLNQLDEFPGGVSGDTVTFDLGGTYGYYYGAPVQERLPNGQILGIFGTINAVATAQSISGTLVGGFTLQSATCSSANNQAVFIRQ